ncbi:MAG: A/G-specific adenine glycosylase [Bacteroidales bacterium]|nr:A/G-specific adenine glycosylase [Bacteroidales bacterium]
MKKLQKDNRLEEVTTPRPTREGKGGGSFTPSLLRWFACHGRSLPWRETRDPYAIWLSEVILQQTRIAQGMDYWQRFIRRWPTVEQLAAATEDEVLREWQGLGYYSRARNLHSAAKQIVAMGGFPKDFETIRTLKGVGDYTAAAIASIAFDQPHAVVDGNVYRVLARHFGIDTPINSTEGKKVFSALAQSLLPEKQASDFNQAMMDFGAIQCTPQSPRCIVCPLQETCDALHTGRIETLPVKQRKTEVKMRHLTYIYIRCNGYTAIRKRPAGDIWQGLWEVYTQTPPHSEGQAGEVILIRKNVRHVLTHRILLADFYLWVTDERPPLPDDYIWVKEKELDKYAKPRLMERLLEALPA